ncbi:Nucleoporin [Vanrija pseudolonga]|uniref:Nucleoporin n=1 Tax=Vanrija pseudolonga TaxID=143232 RepID=A0AAF1BIG5_9TREE|nr:Nucleoporin [Vanrija pseudolonga]
MFGSSWGQNNQQQQQQQPQQTGGLFGSGGTSTGFGGNTFGQQQQNTGGFGQPAQQNTGTGLFGSSSANTGFGGGGGFGQPAQQAQTSTFGARPSFGATGSSTFGQANTTTGGGLFGSQNNNSTFGQNNASTSGGLFGAKPATSGFGSSPASGGLFGSKPATGFGASGSTSVTMPANHVYSYNPGPPPPPPTTGTQAPPYQPTWQRDPAPGIGKELPPPHLFHVINAMDAYKGASFEELRMMDYQQNRKEPTAQPAAAGGFGQPAAGGFGQPTSAFGQPAASTSTFGQKPATGGLFGSTSATPSGFGTSNTAGGFGQPQNTGTGLFGQNNTSTFGQQNTNTGGGLFGQQQNQANTTGGGLFGNNNNNSSPFGQNQQQQQPASTGFGGFGQAANKPAFGAATTSAFGQPAAATTGFGQQSTGTTGFGGFGQQQQQQQQPAQTGGLFGQQNTTTNAFGQTNTAAQPATSLFGQTNTQTGTTGGLFGNAAAKPAGGLFGSTPAATTGTTGFGGFGQSNTAAQPATGGLFGQTNAAAPATGTGLFGSATTQQPAQPASTGGLFGNANNAATGSSLFGAKPATTGGLFGNAAAQPAATGTTGFGGFGQAQATTGGGLFGNTQAAAAPKPGGLFGSGSSLFGQQTQQPAAATGTTGGLFGSALGQSQPATSGLFGSTNQQPAQTNSLFGSTLGQSTLQQQQQPNLMASVDQNPYGNNDLFKYNNQQLEISTSNKKPALPPLTTSTFRVTPSKGRVSNLRGFGSPYKGLNSSQGSARGGSPGLGVSSSPSRSLYGTPVPSDRYKGLTEQALSPNAFIPRPSVKKLTISKQQNGLSTSDDRLESVLGKSALKSSANGNGSAPPTPGDNFRSRSPAVITPRVIDDTPTRRPPTTVTEVAVRPPPVTYQHKKGDYWCRPSIDKLRMLSHDQLSSVANFSAGRKGYGEVTFLDPVDLTTLSSLNDVLGGVIVVEDLELTVYPDETNKPERGNGLNVPAEISLENCFARDKGTKQIVTDPSDPRYQRHLKRIKAIRDTEFISFTEDGVWTFRVEHFSKYGLLGSDDEESDEDTPASPTPAPFDKSVDDHSMSDSFDDEEDVDFLPPTKSIHDTLMHSDEGSFEDTEESDSYDEDVEQYDDEPADVQGNWDRPIKTKLGAEGMRKLRQMQSSFYGSQPTKAPRTTPAQAQRAAALEAARALQRKREDSGFESAEEGDAKLGDRAVKRASFGESSSPPLIRQPRKYAKVPLADSFVGGNEGVRADAGLALGRSFRCSWGPNGELVHFGKICAPHAKFSSSSDPVVMVEDVQLLAQPAAIERPRAERLLNLLLEHTNVEDVDGVPTAFIDNGVRFKEFAALFPTADRSHEASVWRLGQALFDEIDLGLPAGTPDEVRGNVAEVRRKLALSKWLEDAVAPAVDADLLNAGDNRPAKVFTLLTGNQVDRAVQSALDGKDMRLATLVSQAGGPDVFRAEVARQLQDWNQFGASGLIGYDYRKLYALLAGVTDVSPGGTDSSREVLVAEGLDWKRAFGLRLWYGCSFEDSIAGVLADYSEALQSAHPPARPLPPYLEKPGDDREWTLPTQPTDVLFNLLKLYSDLTVSLDNVLSARDCSPSPTDFRLPWHLYLLLSRVLAKRDFEDREEADDDGQSFSATADQITSSYAQQLEEEGQWTWAAFVLLHLERASSRRTAIQALLFRHPEPSPRDQDFLINTLHVPIEWLHEARAANLAAEGDVYKEYYALIPANLPDRAQRLLVGKLAPEAALRDDRNLLRRLCEALEPLKPTGWEYNGGLYLEYLEIVTEVKGLLKSVKNAGAHPDPHDAEKLSRLGKSLLRVIQLLPALFPDTTDVQQVASLSYMLSQLQVLAVGLHEEGVIPRPPVSKLLVDKDRLHLLQGAATESFEQSLSALTPKE